MFRETITEIAEEVDMGKAARIVKYTGAIIIFALGMNTCTSVASSWTAIDRAAEEGTLYSVRHLPAPRTYAVTLRKGREEFLTTGGLISINNIDRLTKVISKRLEREYAIEGEPRAIIDPKTGRFASLEITTR